MRNEAPTDLWVIWECAKCGRELETHPGERSPGRCGYCGGTLHRVGESYPARKEER